MSVKSLQKQLLAAIAMVVVAAIAMSSATFAWFVNNSQVTATGATATATTSKLLLISTDNKSYGTSTNLGVSLKALTPVSAGKGLIEAGTFYKVKSWANGEVSESDNPYGVLADTYVLATGGAKDDTNTTYDYAVQTIYLKSDVANSTIALDSSTTQLTASKTVTVNKVEYEVVATYQDKAISCAVYATGDDTKTAVSETSVTTDSAVTAAEEQLKASLGALRVALVPYGEIQSTTKIDELDAGDAIVLTNSTTSSVGYYNTNGSAVGDTAANINTPQVINEVTEISNTKTYTAKLATDPAAAISTYTATVENGEVKSGDKYTSIGTLEKADTPYLWKAYIYIEGCDQDCVSNIAGSVTYGVQLGFIQSVGNSSNGSSSNGSSGTDGNNNDEAVTNPDQG